MHRQSEQVLAVQGLISETSGQSETGLAAQGKVKHSWQLFPKCPGKVNPFWQLKLLCKVTRFGSKYPGKVTRLWKVSKYPSKVNMLGSMCKMPMQSETCLAGQANISKMPRQSKYAWQLKVLFPTCKCNILGLAKHYAEETPSNRHVVCGTRSNDIKPNLMILTSVAFT